MTTTSKNLAKATANITTLMTTELNALANNSLVVSSVGGSSGAFDFTAGDLDGYQRLILQLTTGGVFGGAPTAGTGFSIWFLNAIDGSTYEDGSSSVTPARPPDCVIPVRAATAAQVLTRRCESPVGTVKILFKNDGIGRALPATGNTLKCRPWTDQQV